MKKAVNMPTSAEAPPTVDTVIVKALAKLDGVALGVSVGSLFGLTIFLATILLVSKGGDQVGPNLGLLSHYFIGYEVTWVGSLIGLFYGFVFGFIVGWLIAFLRNAVIGIYLHALRFKSSVNAVNDFLDHP
jgi:hypothetical protein